MSKVSMLAVALAISVVPFGAVAEDGKDQPKAEVKPIETSPAEAKPAVKEVVYEEDHEGGFKSFWVHTVGGKIHRGLKRGTNKIEGGL